MNPPNITNIQEDLRGSVSRITMPEDGKNRQISLIFTKKGIFRGGDVHEGATQYNVILSGKWEIWCHESGRDEKIIRQEGEFLEIKPKVPHLFFCTEDSWMLEWWNKPSEEVIKEDSAFYPRYRKIAEKANKEKTYSANLPEDFENENPR